MNNRAYYKNDIKNFITEDGEKILGELTRNHHFNLEQTQTNAWLEQIQNLKQQLSGKFSGKLFFEFLIPRMGKRVDVVLLIDDVIFVIEYKSGSKSYDQSAKDQALDYALDLKNFHEGSHSKYIVPILVSTKAEELLNQNTINWFEDNISNTLLSNGQNLSSLIFEVLKNLSPNIYESEVSENKFSLKEWDEYGYKPTPTIIEAAQALYNGHKVEEISRSDASTKNLTITSSAISKIVEISKQNQKKSICFVTGVPGAGKTLAGLNISTQSFNENNQEDKEPAVFLSGNGPLVKVLREALARDKVTRLKEDGTTISKKQALSEVSQFIQNIHHFRDEGLKSNDPPVEHVVIFDEAQRAWNREHAERFMVQKRGVKEFNMSEPEFLISLMDRRKDWSVIVCLIGGGQEINTGEAGLIEWFNALQNSFPEWDVYHSGQLKDKNYNWGGNLIEKLNNLHAIEDPSLHLSVSIRSFRAEKLSDFVASIIDADDQKAVEIYGELKKYPIAITRNIDTAKKWLRNKARGSERFGLLASSRAIRLKPEGIHVKADIEPINWFLNGKEDIRSSYYLEDAATEFAVQGLELDWTGVCWDPDLRIQDGGWQYFDFKGTKWQNINDPYRRTYLSNTYRVLLTRARQGMVIFIPQGDDKDHTRPRKYYDETYSFLLQCGIKEIL